MTDSVPNCRELTNFTWEDMFYRAEFFLSLDYKSRIASIEEKRT